VARYDLGLSSEEFFDCTPRQLEALVKRFERAQEHKDFMLAQNTAYTINFSMAAPKKPVSPRDLMPSEWNKVKAKQKHPRMRSRKVIAQELEAVMESAMEYQRRQGMGAR
jgi:hypothetical protein